MNDIVEIPLPDEGGTIELPHKALFWFVRKLIDWHPPTENERSGPAGQRSRYARVISAAEGALTKKKIPFFPIRDVRRSNLIAKGYWHLAEHEIDFLLKGLKHVWMLGVPEAIIRELAQEAKTKVERTPRGDRVAEAARFLGLGAAPESQKFLRAFRGEYLIFRRLAAASKIVVGHMQISQDEAARHPAVFVTKTFAADDESEAADEVHGIIYQAPEASGVLFAVGQYVDTHQVRSTILEPHPKLVLRPEGKPKDLRGVRLGLSRESRQPLAYRIWCARLTVAESKGKWQEFAREYVLDPACPTKLAENVEFAREHGCQPQQFFEKNVEGFERILEQLVGQGYVPLDPNGTDR